MPKKPPPKPRAPLATAGFSVPYAELASAARHFAAACKADFEVVAGTMETQEIDGRTIQIPQTRAIFRAQRSSKAAQVFAAMAVEAAINTFGVVHFGIDQFEEHYGRGSLVTKLKNLLRDALGKALSDTDPIVIALKSLGAKRNALVHVRPDEFSPDADGIFREKGPAVRGRSTSDAADQAVTEMRDIVDWLRKLDFQAYHQLNDWPLDLDEG